MSECILLETFAAENKTDTDEEHVFTACKLTHVLVAVSTDLLKKIYQVMKICWSIVLKCY